MYSGISNETMVIYIISGILGLVSFFALVRIFTIDKTLREILAILKKQTEKKD